MNWGFRVGLAAWFVCMSLGALAQSYSLKHYGVEQSLFPSRIECIHQFETGELAIGTLGGLVVYNGYEFETYTVDNGLAENGISAMLPVQGGLLLGHWNGSLTMFNLDGNPPVTYQIEEQLGFSAVQQLVSIGESTYLVLTESGKVFQFSNSELVEQLILPMGDGVGVQSIFIEKNLVYALSEQGLHKSGYGTAEFEWDEVYSSDSVSLHHALHVEDSKWIFATTRGLIGVDLDANERIYPGLTSRVSRHVVSDLTNDSQGNVWVATEEAGVFIYHPIQDKVGQLNRSSGLSYNQVHDVFRDRENNIWIGTSAGLDQYLGDAFRLYGMTDGLSDNLIWDIETLDGHAYLASRNAVQRAFIGSEDGVFEILEEAAFTDVQPRVVLASAKHGCLVIDAAGGLWVSPLDRLSFTHQSHLNFKITSMEEVEGEIWLGTDEGVIVLSEWRAAEKYTTETGLAGTAVSGIYHSEKTKTTWITFLGGKTTLLKSGKFSTYGPEEGLNTGVIQDAAFDSKGNIWFASYDQGVFYFDGQGFQSIGKEVDQTTKTAFAIEIDPKDNVWIGHNLGLDMVSADLTQHNSFGRDVGFMGVEVNTASMKYVQGNGVWMGTLLGLLQFKPLNQRTNIAEPQIRISRATLGSKNLLKADKPLDFNMADNDLSVSFQSISLTNPDKNVVKYRLKGVHNNWKLQSDLNPIEYISLPPGNFQFEILACNDAGVCNAEPISLSFGINPPFYRAWWFYCLVFFLVVFAIYFMDKYRAVNLLEETNKLKDKLDHRNQELIEMKGRLDSARSMAHAEDSMFLSIEKMNSAALSEASELLPNFVFKSKNLYMIGSNGLISVDFQSYRVLVMVDVCVGGNIAHAIRAYLLGNLEKARCVDRDPVQILEIWKGIVSNLEATFPKYKGVNWLMCLEVESLQYFASEGFCTYEFKNESVEEIKADPSRKRNTEDEIPKGYFKLNMDSHVLCHSVSLFNHLNVDGTKNYPREHLFTLMSQIESFEGEATAQIVINDVDEWRGTMEQFEDIGVYLWSYV